MREMCLSFSRLMLTLLFDTGDTGWMFADRGAMPAHWLSEQTHYKLIQNNLISPVFVKLDSDPTTLEYFWWRKPQ